MAFRKTLSQDELRKRLPADEQETGPTYQSSRGGWFPEPVKPVAGNPKSMPTGGGR
ncbi:MULTISPECIES: hypothetical protein [Streptomyces]|uniref:hypothetical protein n=1 Tax=Streptomyces TaxID=1883 RepID=UPI000302B9C5|nr:MULTISPECIES: hypothetical protein [Streptomyces]MYS65143.1 hypothetical protein [Streptomyces sp. SID5473]